MSKTRINLATYCWLNVVCVVVHVIHFPTFWIGARNIEWTQTTKRLKKWLTKRGKFKITKMKRSVLCVLTDKFQCMNKHQNLKFQIEFRLISDNIIWRKWTPGGKKHRLVNYENWDTLETAFTWTLWDNFIAFYDFDNKLTRRKSSVYDLHGWDPYKKTNQKCKLLALICISHEIVTMF